MLKFEEVSYQYSRSKQIFDQFSWAVPSGRTVLLGPNGAGKTTLLGLASSLLAPHHGAVCWNELASNRPKDKVAYRQAVGWMPQHIYAVPGLRVGEQLIYAGWLKGLTHHEARLRLEPTLAQVDMLPLVNQKADTLSIGRLARVVSHR